MPRNPSASALHVISGVSLLLAATICAGCGTRYSSAPTVALIPRSAEGLLWEGGRLGATEASERAGCRISWNAPTSDSDVTGQISLIDNVVGDGYQGLILAPNHPLAILAPVRQAVAAGVPVVIISTPLDLPASEKLGYIVNDDAEMGALAAAEIARLIGGQGSIAFIGLSRGAAGVSTRVKGAEQLLVEQFPDIRVVSRRGGAFSASTAQETATAVLAEHHDLKAILTFTANATRGVHAALKSRSERADVSLVGCEQDSDLIEYIGTGEIAAVVAMNTYHMAYEAVDALAAAWAGEPMPPLSVVPPMLITKQSLPSTEARSYLELRGDAK